MPAMISLFISLFIFLYIALLISFFISLSPYLLLFMRPPAITALAPSPLYLHSRVHLSPLLIADDSTPEAGLGLIIFPSQQLKLHQ